MSLKSIKISTETQSGTNGFIEGLLVKHMFSTVSAYFLGCLSVVITGIMVGALVDSNGLAAVSFCLPVYYLFAAVGTLIQTGTSTFAAIKIGNKDFNSANRFYAFSYLATLVCSVFILVLGLVFLDPIVSFLGAEGELFDVTKEYLKILIIGSPAALFMYFPLNYLRITSHSELSPLCYLFQTVLSIVLTYVFISFFDMGSNGAALATVVSNYALSLLGTLLVIKFSDFSFTNISNCKKELVATVKAGSPIALDSIGCLIRVLFLNSIAYKVGGTVGVCIIGIVTSVAEFCAAVLLGAPQSTVSLLAIFNSEKDTFSIRKTAKSSIRFGLLITAVLGALLSLFAPQIASLYGISEPELNIIAANSIRIFVPGLLFGLVTCTFTTIYATTGNSSLANVSVILRNFALVIPFALLFAHFTENIVLLTSSLPIAEVLTLLITVIAAYFVSRKSKIRNGILLLDDRVEKSGKIAALSVKNTPEDIVACSEQVSEFCETNSLPSKVSMTLSLSIEEMLMVISEKCLDSDPNEIVDVRLFCASEIVGLRIRNAGKRFNILEYAEENADDMDCMGINMIKKLSDVVEYQNTFGANNLLVILK